MATWVLPLHEHVGRMRPEPMLALIFALIFELFLSPWLSRDGDEAAGMLPDAHQVALQKPKAVYIRALGALCLARNLSFSTQSLVMLSFTNLKKSPFLSPCL